MDRINKAHLRRRIIRLRDALDAAQHGCFSQRIICQLLEFGPYKSATTVLLFAGVRSEVDTKLLVAQSLSQGKKVVMPRCIPQRRGLSLLRINSWDDLSPSFYGLLEPSPFADTVSSSDLEAIVVPAVAFSADGYRIGYGGGYYDRLLAGLQMNVTIIGVAFGLQLISEPFAEQHDEPVDYLFTENGLLECFKIRKLKMMGR